jgi:hypothetical protein
LLFDVGAENWVDT